MKLFILYGTHVHICCLFCSMSASQSHWLVLMYSLVFCIGSCVAVHEDRTLSSGWRRECFKNVLDDAYVIGWLKVATSSLSRMIAIAAVDILASLLSILGAGSIIIRTTKKRIVQHPEIFPLFHLSLADLVLALLWLISATCWLMHDVNSKTCFYLGLVAEIFHLASFFLTVNYGVTAYQRLKERTRNINNMQISNVYRKKLSKSIMPTSCKVCWALPFVIMLPLFVAGISQRQDSKLDINCSNCLILFDRPKIHDNGPKAQQTLWLLYGSFVLALTLSSSIVVLVVIYLMALRTYKKAIIHSGVMTDYQRSSIKDIRSRIFLYKMVFLICWIPTLVVAVADLSNNITIKNQMDKWFVLFLFQSLTAPLQGFLNSIVYGWRRKRFREALEKQRSDSRGLQHSSSYGSTT